MANLFIATAPGYDGAKRVFPGEKVMLNVDKAPSWALTEEEYADMEAGLAKQADAEALAAVSAGLDGNLPGQAPQPKKEKLKGKDEAKPAKVESPVAAGDLLDQNANTVKKSLRDGKFTNDDLAALLAAEKGREAPRDGVIDQIEALIAETDAPVAAGAGADDDAAKSEEELADG